MAPYRDSNGLTANQAYDLVNTHYFGGRLPKIKVRWTIPKERVGILGATVGDPKKPYPLYIGLNAKYRNSSRIWGLTLIHEMVHVEQWATDPEDIHGEPFLVRMRELAAAGAFDHLW